MYVVCMWEGETEKCKRQEGEKLRRVEEKSARYTYTGTSSYYSFKDIQSFALGVRG